MSSEEKACEKCGQIHEGSKFFSKNALALFQKFEAEKDPTSKEELLLEIGQAFMDHIDSSDDALPDEVHQMVEEALLAFQKHEALIRKLGRTAVRSLRYATLGKQLLDEITPEAPTPTGTPGGNLVN